MKKTVISLFLCCLTMLNTACLKIRMSDKKLYQFFENTGVTPEIQYFYYADRKIRYLKAGKGKEVLLFLLHGSPGSMKTVTHLLGDSLLLANTTMLALDKPGYGFSDFGRVEPELDKQLALVLPILEKYKNDFKHIILVGSSYGGTLATRLAMEKPDWIDGLVLAAASVAPKEEKIYWFSYPACWIVIRWFVPKTLKMANREKFAHEAELNKMIPLWERIKVPVVILHGKDDGLIYPTNPAFAEKQLTQAESVKIIMFEDQNHFVLWEQTATVVQEILTMIENIQAISEEKSK